MAHNRFASLEIGADSMLNVQTPRSELEERAEQYRAAKRVEYEEAVKTHGVWIPPADYVKVSPIEEEIEAEAIDLGWPPLDRLALRREVVAQAGKTHEAPKSVVQLDPQDAASIEREIQEEKMRKRAGHLQQQLDIVEEEETNLAEPSPHLGYDSDPEEGQQEERRGIGRGRGRGRVMSWEGLQAAAPLFGRGRRGFRKQ